ncbi:50S ribosomal protein L17 [Candidatus Dependentiae bacterium]|nr:50S ribosomal protein L17 [Candidatus Dependentiae bacterium]
MMHQCDRKKLNIKQGHRKALLRNQAISLILHGHIQSTTTHIKVLRSYVEKIVTLARAGDNFNTIRRISQELPYDKEAVYKLIREIAPKYVQRPGGYLRIYNLGRRPSDTAPISRIEWV